MKKIVAALLMAGVFAYSLQIQPAFAKNRKAKKTVIRGFVSALSDVSITVNDKVIAITSRTHFEDFFGAPTSAAAFRIGDCVKVNLIKGSTTAKAKEIELDNKCPNIAESTPTSAPTPTAVATASPVDDHGRGGREKENERENESSRHGQGGRGRH